MQSKIRRSYLTEIPTHNWFTRAARAIFVEHRVPHVIDKHLNKALLSIGFKYKTIRIGDLRVKVRRCTADEAFVKNVIVDEEYFNHDYVPRKDDTIVDIGANIGCFTLAAASKTPNGKIISIEPFPANIELLKTNIKLNRLYNVHIVTAAITDKVGQIELHIGHDTGMHSLKFDTGRGAICVKGMRLEDIFTEYKIEWCNFLKIDCEGAEFDFLPTLPSHVWERIERIVMEFSVPIPDWNFQNPTKEQIALKQKYGEGLVDILERNKFRIGAYVDCANFRAGYIYATNLKSQLVDS